MGQLFVYVDVGSSTTKVICARVGGPSMPLLFDEDDVLPSGVYLHRDGTVYTGAEALTNAINDPARYVPDVFASLRHDHLTIAGSLVDPITLLTALFTRIRVEARRQMGRSPTTFAITARSGWIAHHRQQVAATARRAVMPDPITINSLVAAARHVVETAEIVVPLYAAVLICDLGAAACRVSVAQRHDNDHWVITALYSEPRAGGNTINDLLLRRIPTADPAHSNLDAAGHVGSELALRQCIQTAKHAASSGHATAISIPGQRTEMWINSELLRSVCREISPLLGATVGQPVAAHRDDGEDPTVIALIGGGAHLPGIDAIVRTSIIEAWSHVALQPAAIGPVLIADRPVHAIAHGMRNDLARHSLWSVRRRAHA